MLLIKLQNLCLFSENQSLRHGFLCCLYRIYSVEYKIISLYVNQNKSN